MAPQRSTGPTPCFDEDRSRTAQDAARAERLHSALVASATDAIWAVDTRGRLTAFNGAAERLYAWPAADVMGRSATVLLPAGAHPFDLVHADPADRDVTHATRTGDRLDLTLTLSPIIADGRRIGTSAIARRRSAGSPRAGDEALDRALGEALDADAVLDVIARALVPRFADACITYSLRKGGSVQRAGVRHADPAQRDTIGRLLALPEPRLDDPDGPGAVLRTGMPVLIADVPADTLESAAMGPHGAPLRALGLRDVLLLPLRARGRTVGAVALLTVRASGRSLDRATVTAAGGLVDRAALALDNARLFAESQAELARRHLAEDALRQRFEHLGVVYHMTEAVGRADALEGIYDEALDGLRRGVHIRRAAILLCDEEGVMRFRAWRGLSDRYRAAVEGHSPWEPGEHDPQPIVITDVDAAADLSDELRAALRDEGIRAVAFIPLVFRGRLLGRFMLYFDEPRILTNDELALAQTIAGTIAFAISRVRSEQSVRAAKEIAEHASQAKSQFLGVMSHELRTPLNAVLGYADLLLMEVRGTLNEGQREQIDRIRVSAQHQLQLIEELLTYTRLQAGREELRIIPTDLRRVVCDVAEFVRPEAERKGLKLDVQLPDEPLELVTDPARLRQIILNFAANATKFTTEGAVSIGAARIIDGFAVRVRDTGPGIPPDKIDYIFEPFAQASEGRTRDSGGTGLGLSIARRFADLLGATIDVRSRPGAGATFTLRLPLSPPLPTR